MKKSKRRKPIQRSTHTGRMWKINSTLTETNLFHSRNKRLLLKPNKGYPCHITFNAIFNSKILNIRIIQARGVNQAL